MGHVWVDGYIERFAVGRDDLLRKRTVPHHCSYPHTYRAAGIESFRVAPDRRNLEVGSSADYSAMAATLGAAAHGSDGYGAYANHGSNRAWEHVSSPARS